MSTKRASDDVPPPSPSPSTPKKKKNKNNNNNDYKNYLARVSRDCSRLRCLFCEDCFFAFSYEFHCTHKHDLNTKLRCAWCGGRFSWPRNTKIRHGDHLLACFKKFAFERPVKKLLQQEREERQKYLRHTLPPMRNDTVVIIDKNDAHRPCSSFFFERENVHRILLGDHSHSSLLFPGEKEEEEEEKKKQKQLRRTFRTVWPVDYVHPSVPFRDKNLNWAVCNTRQYLKTRHTHDWFQIVVGRGTAFDSLLNVLDSEGGKTKTLYFFRWCQRSGGGGGINVFHRHVIAVCHPKGRFLKEVWSKVVRAVTTTATTTTTFTSEKKDRVFECSAREIVSPLNFVRCLGAVGRPDSKCDFFSSSSSSSSSTTTAAAAEDERPRLLYLNLTLPTRYEIPSVVQWAGGVSELLREDMKKNYVARGSVLPVDKRYAPVDRITGNHWCLDDKDRRVYFEKSFCNAILSEAEWLKKQAAGGNCFYDSVIEREREKREEKKTKKGRKKK